MTLTQEEAFARIRLLRSPNVGPASYAQLLRRFGDGVAALAALPDLAARGGAPYRPAAEARIEEETARVRKAGARYLFHDSPDYPALLGQTDGFLGNPKVRIPLPGFLNDAAKLLKATGGQKKVDELVTAMNRAAEAAVPQARTLLVNAAKSMSVDDALKIVRGGDTSVTTFFADKTRTPLSERFLPVVNQATEKVGLVYGHHNIYHRLADGPDAGEPVFSMANIKTPGSFDMGAMQSLETPAVAFFLTLPAPVPALEAWDTMLPIAERMAQLLDAVLLDALDPDRITWLPGAFDAG